MNLVTSDLRDGVAAKPMMASERQEVQRQLPLIRQYLRVALRWRFVIIGCVAACVIIGLIVTLLMTPEYTADSTIEISRDADQVTNFQGVQHEVNVADQEFYQTQYGLLESRALAERVAVQLNFVDDPHFFRLFGDSKKNSAFTLVNGRYPASGQSFRRREAGDILLHHIDIAPTRLSRLVDIRFRSPDAALSTKVANAWADNFIQANLDRKIQATSYGRNLLQQQLTQIKQKLDESQRQLVDYASAQKIITLPAETGANGTTSERSIVADNLASLNAVLAQATADRIQAEARYREAGAAGASPEALSNLSINELREKRGELAAQYQQLMTQFEPGYPAAKAIKSQIDQLDRSIATEDKRVSGSLLANYQQALAREKGLQTKVDELKTDYLDLRRRSIQYNIYQQEVDTNKALYDGLLERFKQIGVSEGVGINNVSIVDPAEMPEKPSSPRLFINLALSLLTGLALGAGVAFALEQLDEAITEPTEVERRLGLPLLGSVPKVDGGSPQSDLLDRKSELVEAYLAVQTSLSFTTEHGVPRSFMVTSTRPGEGKSTTALAMATMLTRSQHKVVLVDADMRSPSVHLLAGTNHDRGLSNFLAGEDDVESLLFPMGEFGFTAMTAGPIPPNAAELLTGSRLSVLISRLLEQFDHVVVDSPPVMGLADAPLIATRVEGVIYAVESHGIHSTQIKTALDRLASAHARVMGVVLTKFDARKSHYGYSYEYGYSYGRDEKGAPPPADG